MSDGKRSRWSGELDVTTADGETTRVRVPPSARRAFERDQQKPLIAAMASGYSDWIDFLAWKTFQLRHGVTDDLEAWLDTIDAIDVVMVKEDQEDPGSGATTPPLESSPS